MCDGCDKEFHPKFQAITISNDEITEPDTLIVYCLECAHKTESNTQKM